jgi:hypothetical protein
METPIFEKGEVQADIKFEAGKVKLVIKYDGKGADVTTEVALESDYFLDKLAEAIPGNVDDAVISMLKAAIKKL